MKPKVLVVDDDEGVRYTIAGILEEHDTEVLVASCAAEALALLDVRADAMPSLVITDIRMPGMDGLALLDAIQERPSPPKVVVITAHGSERTAVDAVKRGAYDYFRKPFEIDEMLAVVDRALDSARLQATNEQLRGELALARSMVFESPAMKRLAVLVGRVAPRDVTVLIRGESGTGKERLAEAIVAASERASAPFVRFNCAALNPELIDAELFGHAKGAYTGAHQSRLGLLREAEGGTIFLDEIGELAGPAQAKLLRVLQERQVRPVGDSRPISIDVRVLAATHRNLEEDVEAKRFREDLYYRLKVVTLTLPPLRDRPEDIPLLTKHFLRTSGERMGLGPIHPTPQLLAHVQGRQWPGNIRELLNEIESLVALSDDGELDLSTLSPSAGGHDLPSSRASAVPGGTLKAKIAAFERQLLVDAIARADGNRSEAARALGIGRATLHDKLSKHGL
ncbi:MAG: sigma-54 dependent transcriptional regulator [Nannocystaceae bacterium]